LGRLVTVALYDTSSSCPGSP